MPVQRPTPGRRTYIALYRDGMLGKVEDFSRLVFPEQEGKRLAFLDSMNKQQDGKTRLVSQNGGGKGRASGDNASLAAAEPKFRPLAELTDRVSWDGTCWKQGPKDSRLPYDGWPGIRRQVHWEPLRGGPFGFIFARCTFVLPLVTFMLLILTGSQMHDGIYRLQV